ncbi:MAG: glycosyltransferase family 4 protein [Acidobacteria bacterium]|nr:glycosyltransferase family 4 protein [Acidobacteriota bacterium]
MRIAIDAHAIGQHLTGNEVYVRNLLSRFPGLDRKAQFIAYTCAQSASEWIPEPVEVHPVSRNPFLRLGWDLPRLVNRQRPDLLHVQYTAPLFSRVPIVVTVHDVSFLHHPEYFPAPRVRQLAYTVERTVRRAAAILTPSDFSRRSIALAYGIPQDNIAVVHNGVSPTFRPISRETAGAFVSGRFQISQPYIMTVGDLQPRKNQIGLIRAFEEVMREFPKLPHHLVLVGKDKYQGRQIHEAAERSPLRGRIHLTGFVNDDELLRLYNACDLFVFPSLYEGFGIPILEAMACGCAVACSNTSAMPEVADASAILFDPASPAEMVRAMRDILLDSELRARLQKLGQKNATRFSWEEAARRTLDVYRHVAEKAPGTVRPRQATAV